MASRHLPCRTVTSRLRARFVDQVGVLPSGEWITCSEDRTLRVWPAGGGECVQSITHPASVWACAACPNGDVAVGCADGNAYVWTRSADRSVDEAEQLAFKETVASVALPEQQVNGDLGALEKDIKTEEALNVDGTKEGENLIVSNEDEDDSHASHPSPHPHASLHLLFTFSSPPLRLLFTLSSQVRDKDSKTAMLYQWSMGSRKWEKVGEVMGGKDTEGSGTTLGKRMYEGKEYDYLFDIDINGSNVKLPFNSGDDPWMTAQQWLWKNDIDQMHLDAVAQHLIANTPNNVPKVDYGNVDPFTSGGAYRPGQPSSSAAPSGGGGGNVDPFTSGGAYRPGAQSGVPTFAPSSGTEDPLSAKRYRPGNAPPPSAPAPPPSATFAVFNACKHDAVLTKLMQFNSQLAADGDGAALDDAASARLVGVVEALKSASGSAASNAISKADVTLFVGDGASGGLIGWPTPVLFPAIDLLRLLALHPSASPHLTAAQPLLPRLIALLSSCQALGAADKPAAAASLMLLRTFANMASMKELRLPVASAASELLDTLHAPLEHGPSGARLAAATLILNLALTLSSGGELPAAAALKSDAWSLQALSLVGFALGSVCHSLLA